MAEPLNIVDSAEAPDNFYLGLFCRIHARTAVNLTGWKQIVSSFECTHARGSCTIKGNLYAFLGG